MKSCRKGGFALGNSVVALAWGLCPVNNAGQEQSFTMILFGSQTHKAVSARVNKLNAAKCSYRLQYLVAGNRRARGPGYLIGRLEIKVHLLYQIS